MLPRTICRAMVGKHSRPTGGAQVKWAEGEVGNKKEGISASVQSSGLAAQRDDAKALFDGGVNGGGRPDVEDDALGWWRWCGFEEEDARVDGNDGRVGCADSDFSRGRDDDDNGVVFTGGDGDKEAKQGSKTVVPPNPTVVAGIGSSPPPVSGLSQRSPSPRKSIMR